MDTAICINTFISSMDWLIDYNVPFKLRQYTYAPINTYVGCQGTASILCTGFGCQMTSPTSGVLPITTPIVSTLTAQVP